MNSGASAIAVSRQVDTIWKSISTFCLYRVVIAVILALSYWGFQRYQLLTPTSVDLAIGALSFYMFAAALLLAMALARAPRPPLHLTAQVVVDVIAMTVLMHASGGVRSGIGLLLLVTLAASGLVARGRIAFFHASIAALAILLEQSWQILAYEGPVADLLQAGLLAGSFFVIAALGYSLAQYARGAEQIAEERGVDLANLSQINELVIRDMQDGFVVVDENGVIRQHNPQSEQLIGSLNSANGRLLAETAPQLAVFLEDWRRSPERIFSMTRDRNTLKDFQVRFVAISGKFDDERPRPTVIFIEDAGRIRMQAQQMKLVALGRLTASIAHEIRNPLSSINHAAELLQEDDQQSPRRSEDARLLKIIQENAHRLDRMVQEVLYLNRRDRAHPEPIDAGVYLVRFIQDFCANEKIDQSIIELNLTSTLKPVFDRSHLDQVLWNLVRNARNYCTHVRGSINVTFGSGPTNDSLVIDISDDGPGVPDDALPHLFEPFFTTDSRGTGLGLYIARELADVNDARLEYLGDRPAPAKGACFRVTMKRSETAA